MEELHHLSPFEWAMRPLKKFATFEGRAPRAEYWWFYLATLVVGTLLSLMDQAVGHQIFTTILNLALLLPWLAVTVRRLHDTNRSGWWLALFCGSFIVMGILAVVMGIQVGAGRSAGDFTGLIVVILLFLAVVIGFLVLMVLPGTTGPNDYGPDPYGPNDLEEVFA